MSPSRSKPKRNPGDTAFLEERHRQISELVELNGRVRIAELVDRFGVTESTLRKDLSSLESAGVLKRTHGGAVGPRQAIERALDERANAHAEAKNRIGQLCAEEVNPGDAVFIGAGTTNEQIARHLAGTNITVLTNSVPIAAAISDRPGIDHVLLGGRYRSVGGSLVGAVALDTLRRFNVNVAFIGVSGLTGEGITVADPDEAQIAQAAIDRTRKTIVPVDSSKIGAVHFSLIRPLEALDVIVTDRSSEQLEILCEEHRINLRVATEPE